MISPGLEAKHHDHFSGTYDMDTLADRLERRPANLAGSPRRSPRPTNSSLRRKRFLSRSLFSAECIDQAVYNSDAEFDITERFRNILPILQ